MDSLFIFLEKMYNDENLPLPNKLKQEFYEQVGRNIQGSRVYHSKFGYGTITSRRGTKQANVKWDNEIFNHSIGTGYAYKYNLYPIKSLNFLHLNLN